METITATAPSHWAPYLINGDDSGLDARELLTIDAWLANSGLGMPVSCEDAGFCWHHDAMPFALAADCQTYTFLVTPPCGLVRRVRPS